ncbi:MAG: hypothetical protein WCW62_06960 [Bacteroidales bacterium]|jgi:hypothetical protein
MIQQSITGNETEALVRQELTKLGLFSIKPVPDRGVDLLVTDSQNSGKTLKIQVKGRGPIQTNGRYRWFQIRTTQKQREETIEAGFPAKEAWRFKVKKVDCFIMVSLKFNEFWIFNQAEIESIITICENKYGNRKDNREGMQAEIDLDISHEGQPLTKIYDKNLNNWSFITNCFSII